jgi:hypothetical protein
MTEFENSRIAAERGEAHRTAGYECLLPIWKFLNSGIKKKAPPQGGRFVIGSENSTFQISN